MPENRFCLVDEPWIPIVGKGRVSLIDVFTDDSCLDIDGNAIQKISLIKLLFAIAQASVVLKDESEWLALGKIGLAGCVVSYLEKHRDCFYLYGEKPFLQLPILKSLLDKSKERAIYYVHIPDVDNENDSLIRSIQRKHDITDADRAIFIIGLMNYGLGGKRAIKIPSLSCGSETSKSAKPGPSLGSSGYLQTYLKGQTIAETIWLNFFTNNDVKSIAYDFDLDVRPPWEQMPQKIDDARALELKKSIYSWLVGVSRFVLWEGEGLYYVDGLQYPGSVNDGYSEPFITMNRKTKKAIYVDVQKKPWRSLASILEVVYNENLITWLCPVIGIFGGRALKVVDSFAVWAGGLSFDFNAGEQFVKNNNDFIESEFNLTKDIVDSEKYYPLLCSTMLRIDDLAYCLKEALNRYFNPPERKDQDSSKSDKQKKNRYDGKINEAVSRFWLCADSMSNDLFYSCAAESEEMVEKGLCRLSRMMCCIYDDTCPHELAIDFIKWVKFRPIIKDYKRNEEWS